ncbi:MAG: GNAT family N-acetyltransferase [Alphaproteobacteria bacterium]|nr:GNAT family N-acetyltransferase [Alphaproteobacteria bacterium]
MNGMYRSQDLTFRSVTPTDLPLINRLMREGKGYWGYDEAGLDRFMQTFGIQDEGYFKKAFGFIAESIHETIGYYLFTTNQDFLELDYFFLDTRLIGQGYDRQLWNHCVETAQQRGWTTFTFRSDPNSLGFYECMGAVKID